MDRECSTMLNHKRKTNGSQKKQRLDACRNVNVSKNTVVLAIYLILMTSIVTSSAYSSESGSRRYTSRVRSPYRGSTGLKKSVYSGYRSSNSKPKTIFRQTLLGPNVCGTKCCRGWKSGNTALCITPICSPPCKNNGHCIRPLQCLCPNGYKGRDCGQRKHPHSRSADMLMHKRKRQTLIHVRYSDKSKNQGSSSNSEVVCTPTTCFNGGTCVDGSCTCRKGYAGKKCEKVLVMQMNSSPAEAIRTSPSTRAAIELCNALCVHGECTKRGEETPVCDCHPGYYGTMCESRRYGGITSRRRTSVASKVSSGMQYSNNLLRPVAYSNARRIAVPTPRIASTIISKYGKCYRRVGGNRCGLSYSKVMTKTSCCRAGLGDGWGPSCSPCRKVTYQRISQIETKASRLSRTCPTGFANLYGICKDVNECLANQNLCSNGVCVNSRGSYWCRCNRGYHLHVSRSMCLPDKSPSRQSNTVSPNQCYLTLDKYGDCRIGSSAVTESKSICCCSVGKAWGLDCEKCPRRGTVEYYKLCPNGPGYLNSISYAIKRPAAQKPSTVRQRTKTTKQPIIIPSLTMTDTIPTSRKDKTLSPTSKTNIRDSVFDFTQSRSEMRNTTTTQTTKTTQTTTTPLTSTTSSTQPTTTQKPTTTERSTLPDVTTTKITPKSSTTTTEKKETTPLSTTTTTKILTTIATSPVVPSKSTSVLPESEQTRAETTVATEAPSTLASSSVVRPKSTTTEKEVTTAVAATQKVDTYDYEIPLFNTDEAKKKTPEAQDEEEVTTTVRSPTTQETTTPVSVKSTQTTTTTEGTSDEVEIYEDDDDFYIDVYELPGEEFSLDDMDEDDYEDVLEPTQDLHTDQSLEKVDSSEYGKNENESVDIVEPALREVLNGVASSSVSSESFSTTTAAHEVAISLQSDACSPNPCQNNGECTVEDNIQFKCKCTGGYFGMKCETRDHCVPNPCKNGATCEAGMGYYYCDCPDGFFGTDCENQRVPKCQSNPCVHGTCVDVDDDYKCECVQGYQGIQCNEDVNECESDSCKEHSACINTEGSFQCVCLSGFNMADDGLTCEDINECTNSSLCENGKCINNEGSYECECFIGYKLNGNNNCEDLNECDFADCGKTATCRNMVGGFQCVCPNSDELYDMNTKECNSPYTEATKIAEIRKPCYSDPRFCENLLSGNSTEEECCCTIGRSWGECETKRTCPSLMSSAYKELCPVGRGVTTGENNKRMDLNECELFGNENICQNGQCQNSFGGYECVCYKGYYYNRRIQACDDMNECRMRSKCINGRCKNLPGTFRCECPEGTVLRRSGYLTACTPTRRRRPSFPYRPTARNVAGRSSSSEFQDYCYSRLLRNSRCGAPQYRRRQTYKECCCGQGVAWGRSCSKCPQKYSGDYTFLCQNNKVATAAPLVRLDDKMAGVDSVGEFHEQKCEIPGGCENGKCLRTEDGYTCECNAGFQLDEDMAVCMDIDECEALDHVCLNGNCMNQPGTFRCVCQTGFEPSSGDATLCKPVESNENVTDSTETDIAE